MRLMNNFGRNYLKTCLLFISGCLISLPAAAGNLKFITIEVAPWASVNSESQVMEGAFIEMVKEIEARTDYIISTTLTPFARVYREMDSGDHDCTILIPLDEAVVTKGELIAYHDMGVIPRRDIVLSAYEQLYGLNISLLRGSAIMERFDNDEALQKEYDTDYLISLRKIARKRTDAVAGAIPTILFLAEQNNLAEFLGEPITLAKIPLYFQCSLNSANRHVMKSINHAIREMKADGTIDRIQSQYYF